MSILYQALKRREQLDSKSETSFRPHLSTYAQPMPKRTNWLRFLLALGVLAAGGLALYTTYLKPQPEFSLPAAATEAAQPVNTADLLAPTTMATDTVQIDDFNPAELKSIADVAAMLPDSAQQPLPTPAVKMDGSNSPDALNKRAMALQSRGARDAAIMLYNDAGNDFHTRVNKWGLMADANPGQALPMLRQLVSERPRDAAARAQLGIALVKLQRLPEARIELEKAAALAPETTPSSAQVWHNLAVLYDSNNEQQAAIIAYEKALHGALAHNQQDYIDTIAIQRRLNYLRGTPVERTTETNTKEQANVP